MAVGRGYAAGGETNHWRIDSVKRKKGVLEMVVGLYRIRSGAKLKLNLVSGRCDARLANGFIVFRRARL